jgi:hypothetical protein
MGRTERCHGGHRHRMHDMLREFYRRRPVYVRTHVYVLRMRVATMAGQRRRTLSPLQGRDQGRYPYLQILEPCPPGFSIIRMNEFT